MFSFLNLHSELESSLANMPERIQAGLAAQKQREELIEGIFSARKRQESLGYEFSRVGPGPLFPDFDEIDDLTEELEAKSFSDLEEELLRAETRIQDDLEDLVRYHAIRFEAAQTQLNIILGQIEEVRAGFANFDVAAYKTLQSLIVEANYQEKRAIDSRDDMVGAIRPEFTRYDWEGFNAELKEAIRQPHFRADLKKAMVKSTLPLPSELSHLEHLAEAAVASALSTEVLVVARSVTGIASEYKSLAVRPEGDVYLIPFAALTLPGWKESQDAIDADQLTEADIETIATLYGGDAYPTLADARDGALALRD